MKNLENQHRCNPLCGVGVGVGVGYGGGGIGKRWWRRMVLDLHTKGEEWVSDGGDTCKRAYLVRPTYPSTCAMRVEDAQHKIGNVTKNFNQTLAMTYQGSTTTKHRIKIRIALFCCVACSILLR